MAERRHAGLDCKRLQTTRTESATTSAVVIFRHPVDFPMLPVVWKLARMNTNRTGSHVHRVLITIGLCSMLAIAAAADERPLVQVFKTVEGTQLEAYVFTPWDQSRGGARSAFLFFHGGGWYEGDAVDGFRLCEHWAGRGMVAITFQYRLADFDEVTPVECLQDANSAVRWVRAHASELGVDPARIVATGGSAGGHLAVCTAMIEGFDEAGEELEISSTPDAVIVWSAPVNAAVDSWFTGLLGDGVDARQLSPAHHIRPNLPPMILFHGTDDETVPYQTVARFAEEMSAVGNRCELQTYEGGHLFHINYRALVWRSIDEFLVSSGFIR
jgi:acetyl esterase